MWFMTLANYTRPQSLLVSVRSDFKPTCQIRDENESTTGWNLKFDEKFMLHAIFSNKLTDVHKAFYTTFQNDTGRKYTSIFSFCSR